jgi:hypothetical protein
LHKTVGQWRVGSERSFQEFIAYKTDDRILQCRCGDWVSFAANQTAMSHDISRPGKVEDQILLTNPLFMHFDRTGVNKEDALDLFMLLKELPSFFYQQGLFLYGDCFSPFRDTGTAQKTTGEVA